MKNILHIITLSLCVAGCANPYMWDKTYRTNKLREVYPSEVTSREDVHNRLEQEPDLITERPENGWSNQSVYFEVEKRTGKEITLVERYRMYDPRSSVDYFGLCYLWFYYDSADRVIDVEWEYLSD